MFQCIDVIVYHVVTIGGMVNYILFIRCNCITILLYIRVQTFRLGVMWMVSRYFSCRQHWYSYLFG